MSGDLACCHQPQTGTGGPTAFYSKDCLDSILVTKAASLTKLTTHLPQPKLRKCAGRSVLRQTHCIQCTQNIVPTHTLMSSHFCLRLRFSAASIFKIVQENMDYSVDGDTTFPPKLWYAAANQHTVVSKVQVNFNFT